MGTSSRAKKSSNDDGSKSADTTEKDAESSSGSSSDLENNEKAASQLSAGNRQKYRFISIAQELVMAARGKLVERNWKHNDDSPATIDDISAFVIPILPYKLEYNDWVKR